MSRKVDFSEMTVDELWQLHEELAAVLSARLIAEKRELEKRLAQLKRESQMVGSPEKIVAGSRPRRAYPRVLPKYRNPADPNETWSGRGKTPKWVTAALKTGRKMEDLLIKPA